MSGNQSDQKIPTFVQIVQPEYVWEEGLVETNDGLVGLPHNKTDAAGIIVPADVDTPTKRYTRIHEMLHARFTPEIHPTFQALIKSGGVNNISAQIAEDVRLTAIGTNLGLIGGDTYIAASDVAVKRNAVGFDQSNAKDQTRLAAMFMASYGSATNGAWNSRNAASFSEAFVAPFTERNTDNLRLWGKRVDDVLEHVSDPQEQLLALAKATDATLRAIQEELTTSMSDMGSGEERDAKSTEENSDASDAGGDSPQPEADDMPAKDSKPEARKESKTSKETEKKKSAAQKAKEMPRAPKLSIEIEAGPAELLNEKAPDYRERNSRSPLRVMLAKAWAVNVPQVKSNHWGEMTVVQAPLSQAVRAFSRREGRATVDGVSPRHWARWFSDRAVFDRRGKRLGGSLLIDVSSSMSWATQHTLDLLDSAPAMTIAIYSGRGGTGKLTIIAKSGKMAAFSKKLTIKDQFDHPDGNVVDGPALAWLAKQAKPRIWFSDGKVTGKDDKSVGELKTDVNRICKMASITMTVNPEEVKELMVNQTTKMPAEAEA